MSKFSYNIGRPSYPIFPGAAASSGVLPRGKIIPGINPTPIHHRRHKEIKTETSSSVSLTSGENFALAESVNAIIASGLAANDTSSGLVTNSILVC